MPTLVIMRIEPHSDGFVSLKVELNAKADDGRELTGFHREVIVPPEQLQELVNQPDVESALAYVAAQIATVDPTFSPERLAQAEYALMAQDMIESIIGKYPYEIKIPSPKIDDSVMNRVIEVAKQARML